MTLLDLAVREDALEARETLLLVLVLLVRETVETREALEVPLVGLLNPRGLEDEVLLGGGLGDLTVSDALLGDAIGSHRIVPASPRLSALGRIARAL